MEEENSASFNAYVWQVGNSCVMTIPQVVVDRLGIKKGMIVANELTKTNYIQEEE